MEPSDQSRAGASPARPCAPPAAFAISLDEARGRRGQGRNPAPRDESVRVSVPDPAPPQSPPPQQPSSPQSPPPQQPSSPQSLRPSPWPGRLRRVGLRIHACLLQPRVRLCVIGVVLLLAGGLIVTSSVWTLPLLIAGALMVLVAWIGARLDGQFAVEWGTGGTQLQFRAKIRPAVAPRPALAAGTATSAAETTAGAEAPDDVVEGEAHTVEIDVAELKALIAAAEADDAGAPSAANVAAIRVARSRG